MLLSLGLSGFIPSPLADPTTTPTRSPLPPSTVTVTNTQPITSVHPITSATPSLTPTRRPSVPPTLAGAAGMQMTATLTATVAGPQANGTITATVATTATVVATLPSTPTRTATRVPTATATVTPLVSSAVTTTTTVTPTLAPTASASPAATALDTQVPITPSTAAKYTLALNAQALSIDALRARTYGNGPIRITRTVSNDVAFKRVLFEYTSDGLRITGTMNIPQGTGPFPVVILDHGYFKPSEYKTGDGTNPAADRFVRNGYLTLAPDYRCYGGSQCATNPLDVGYAIDVLNLIAALPSLPYADTAHIGIWGHSMGGGVTIRVLAVSDQIKVAALYGAVAGDDEVHYCWLSGCRLAAAPTREPQAPRLAEIDPDFIQGLPVAAPATDSLSKLREIFVKSSPTRHLNTITAPVIIHHGEADDQVPIEWSVGLADALSAAGKTALLYTYPGEGHVFTGWNWQLFMARNISFFNEYLNPRETPITVERRVLRQERGISDQSY
jgi:uncharacterized protein